MTVVPRQVVARRHFAAGAIGLALLMYGKLRARADDVAVQVGIWARGPSAWRSIRRWIGAIEQGTLFRTVGAGPAGTSLRGKAERAAMVIVSLVPETYGASESARVFAGAALAA